MIIFDLLNINAEFLDPPPSSWDGLESHRNELSIATELIVVNEALLEC